MIGPKSHCRECKHFDYMNFNGYKCAAFPDGIPKEIIRANRHDKPLPGQGNDIVFELMVIPQKYIIRKTDRTNK